MAKDKKAAPATDGAKADDRRTKCPVSREEFVAGAKPVTVDIGGTKLAAAPKEFSTGSFGWYCNGKIVVEVGGVPVTCQVGLNVTAVGSKPAE